MHFECKKSPEEKNVISVEMQCFMLSTAHPVFAELGLSMPDGSGPSRGSSGHLPALPLNPVAY